MNRINLICLGVKDLPKSLAFYKNIGFQTYEQADNPPIVFFDNQGSKLELFSLPELAKDINAEQPPEISRSGFCGITFACNMKSQQQVDEMMEKVQKHGGTIAKQPQKVAWGGYSGYFQDPDGYYWEIAYADIWQFDANDMLIIKTNS